VADFQRVADLVRTLRQLGEPRPVFRRQLVECPLDRAPGDCVEAIRGLQAAGDLVVVPANECEGVEVAQAVDHRVGIGAIADQIAEDERTVARARGGVGETGLERFQVRMYVGQDQVAHCCALSIVH
jgi:hypothetical protein